MKHHDKNHYNRFHKIQKKKEEKRNTSNDLMEESFKEFIEEKKNIIVIDEVIDVDRTETNLRRHFETIKQIQLIFKKRVGVENG